jgi:hypothetical protein
LEWAGSTIQVPVGMIVGLEVVVLIASPSFEVNMPAGS